MYEAIFEGQTYATERLGEGKSIWVVSLPPYENLIKDSKKSEASRIQKNEKFTAECVRLATVTEKLDRLYTDSLNEFNYTILGYSSNEAKTLAVENRKQWEKNRQKSLEAITNLNETFSWEQIFEKVDKASLLMLVDYLYQNDIKFQNFVKDEAGQRVAYITNLVSNGTLVEKTTSLSKMTEEFENYVKHECAGVLALRWMGYKTGFYLGTLYRSTQYISTIELPLVTFQSHESIVSEIEEHKNENMQTQFAKSKIGANDLAIINTNKLNFFSIVKHNELENSSCAKNKKNSAETKPKEKKNLNFLSVQDFLKLQVAKMILESDKISEPTKAKIFLEFLNSDPNAQIKKDDIAKHFELNLVHPPQANQSQANSP